MSVENHPNLHAVNLTVEIIKAFYESLRGAAAGKVQVNGNIQALVIKFVHDIEEEVDEEVEQL